ncbi:hypothetical protein AX774_g6975 [Zancudomyces culisetae]|uniref:Uncharacterized protein n=1 Tax=Zancudomyces culisetae TaxID=1213189 RepID=A0A1R1PFC0_ZANCU|nr:hypothetical protein AX774_g6975 [Zancudomyces culisetae]|eukprot:OMH79603.1 hypothetical protein AX774_g6975 [Zancudomyces culisetae]
MEYYGGDQGDKGEDKYYGNGGAEYTADNYEYDEIDPYLNIEYQNYDTQNYDRQNYADQYEPYGNQYGGDEMYDEQDYEGQDPYGAPYGEYGGEGYARDYSYNGGGYQVGEREEEELTEEDR